MTVERNSTASFLVEESIRAGLGVLTSGGALVVKSGKFTGRAADDKYIVEDSYSRKVIDWTGKVRPLSLESYSKIRDELLIYMGNYESLYAQERSAGADPEFSLGIELLSTSPVHALFAREIFLEPRKSHPLGKFTILHAPEFMPEFKKYGLRSGTGIITNFEGNEILIFGTAYCGEIKKSIFTVMNTLLPDKNIFPMHTGASMDQTGEVSLFFGLSGTGKTTLSTDIGMRVIGDDEHGLSDSGIFNFEGGCYAKTYGLRAETEPQIYKAATTFSSILENVVLDELRNPLFDDKSITENGRATYPLSFLSDYVLDGKGKVPSNFFFLSADALGVLPAISRLDEEKALYFFLSGYTAKLAGTEAGSRDISATFSHCFGAPFMVRRPMDYGQLLQDFLKKHSINVWLVNTGWYGGACGTGKRYSIDFTRSLIRSIQQHRLPTGFERDAVFGFEVPSELPEVESRMLNPKKLWSDPEAYDQAARELRKKFDENFRKFT